MLKPMVCWGAKGHALVLNEFINHHGFEFVSFFDLDSTLSTPLSHVPLHAGENGWRSWREKWRDSTLFGVVAIGGANGGARVRRQEAMEADGVQFTTLIHPSAYVAQDAQLGIGTQILANATVCTHAVLGKGCIVNTAASVDHECVLGDGVHIAPGARLAGCVSVDAHAMVGTGAVVLPRIHIGKGAVIGAGAVVTKNVLPNTTVFGNPATTHPL